MIGAAVGDGGDGLVGKRDMDSVWATGSRAGVVTAARNIDVKKFGSRFDHCCWRGGGGGVG